MAIRISGLRGREPWRMDVVKQIDRLLERRRVSPAVRVAFFDDDGLRGRVAIRCALTLTPSRGPSIRVEDTARTYSAAFAGAVTVVTRRMKRRIQRRRRQMRYPRPRRTTMRQGLAQPSAEEGTHAGAGGSSVAHTR